MLQVKRYTIRAFNIIAWIAFLPYRQFYLRNTRLPILLIAQAKDEAEAEPRIQKWRELKRNENQYVQVAVSSINKDDNT